MADITEPSRLTINQKINKFENLNNSKKRKLTNSTTLKLHVHRLSDKAKVPKLILNDHGYLLYRYKSINKWLINAILLFIYFYV